MKRLFDLFASTIGFLVLLPLFVLITILIKVNSKGSIFYLQERIGKNGKVFKIYKFRTMISDADKQGSLSLGKSDTRITKIGHLLRKLKFDELPQLINVIKGDMSLVGPRPEIKKYTDLYSKKQREVLKVRPGITDYASLKYIDEEQLLGASSEPEETYINEIMPDKINLNLEYLKNSNLLTDIQLIFKTVFKMFR